MTIKSIIFVLAIALTGFEVTSAASAYSDPHFVGNRSVITHLMEWRYEDIAAECERFLGPFGYGGVQVSPANEHAAVSGRPWWERYQPVSYKVITRSGNEAQFKNMVERCNKVGVRIYVDVVLNHMTGAGSGSGTAKDAYNGDAMTYPGVPFGPNDFHGHESCPSADLEIHDYNNPQEARNCRLSGLRDLKQSTDYVREKQAEYLNHLVEMGVAGFRSDASKHQWPGDLKAILGKVKDLNTKFFPAGKRPFVYHEVIYYGQGAITSNEYTDLGRVIEFRYCNEVSKAFRGGNKLTYFKNFGQAWSMLPDDDALVMIDSHDLQRGHTGTLGLNINFFEHKLLKMTTAFMLGWPYGVTRVMSSYSWPQKIENGKDIHDSQGPPTEGGQDHIMPVRPNADNTCNKEWICEHRWREIYGMVAFRNNVGSAPVVNWWDNADYQIAFGRGGKGFIAINAQKGSRLDQHLKTGLPAGHYCDVISGQHQNGKCTGKTIEVDQSSMAHFEINADDEDPMVAIHVGAKLN